MNLSMAERSFPTISSESRFFSRTSWLMRFSLMALPTSFAILPRSFGIMPGVKGTWIPLMYQALCGRKSMRTAMSFVM